MDAVDVKFAPVRGDKSDTRLEEMFKQIIERVEDLQESSLSRLLLRGSLGAGDAQRSAAQPREAERGQKETVLMALEKNIT